MDKNDIQNLKNLAHGYRYEKSLRTVIEKMSSRADTLYLVATDIEKLIDDIEARNAPG